MRLIDADKFKKQIAGMAIANNYPADKANKMCELIDLQSTAYDVDKVVDQLEKSSNDVLSNIFAYEEDDHKGIYNDGLSNGYEKAIEIVKSGGVY